MKSLQRHMVMVKHVWHTWFSQISCDQKLRINQRSHRSAWRFTGSQSFPVAIVIISYCCATYCDLTWQIMSRLCYGFYKRQYIFSSAISLPDRHFWQIFFWGNISGSKIGTWSINLSLKELLVFQHGSYLCSIYKFHKQKPVFRLNIWVPALQHKTLTSIIPIIKTCSSQR